MYSKYPLIDVENQFIENRRSVLHKLPGFNGLSIVNSVVQSLAPNLINKTPSAFNITTFGDNEENNCLTTARDVQWVMEVLCYGLCLPIDSVEQYKAICNCVQIYCDWMSALVPSSSKSKDIPFPIINEPNLYCRKMIEHLHNVFISRTPSSTQSTCGQSLTPNEIISRQALLYHRVLRTIESFTQNENNILDQQTWEKLLLFLLSINNTLLAPPIDSDKDDIGRKELCERTVSVLFEIWAIACDKYFPSHSFWKTFHHLCISWRHQPVLIEQWSRICLAFTHRLMQLKYNSSESDGFSNILSFNCLNIISKMKEETVSDAWFKFLHIIGNPVELHSPSLISKTCKFSERVYPALQELPQNFYKAMAGLSTLVDTFLGLPVNSDFDGSFQQTQRKSSSKSSSISTKLGKIGFLSNRSNSRTSTTPINVPSQVPIKGLRPLNFSQSKPRINSVLNILGSWLFSACMPGTDFVGASLEVEKSSSSASIGSLNEKKGSLTGSEKNFTDYSTFIENFELGQAEAIGALCRLFSSKKSDEIISPIYLARFYLALQHGLSIKESTCNHVLCNILLNSTRLFEINLNGINILIPDFLKAIEMTINETDSESKSQLAAPIIDLRRACIKLLLSMIPYPLHFNDLPIKDSLVDNSSIIFRSLKPKIINLMMKALKSESDPQNVQMLLAGFLLCVQDTSMAEKEYDQKEPEEKLPERDSQSHSFEAKKNFSDVFIGRGGIPETSRDLFSRSLNIICNLLISNWKTDTHVSLSVLEVLSGLARIRLQNNMLLVNECKKATEWICDFISYQCSRPPPQHSKDMHSTIVAAYQCLTIWFHEHSYLLEDRECIKTLLEVIELGISGSKSKTNGMILKINKELKPASMRVREAAECLLTCLMNHFGYSPSAPCPPECVMGCCLLDESSIIKGCNDETSFKSFKYFVSENSILISLINYPNLQKSICLIRSPFGKYCWSMKFQFLPKKANDKGNTKIPRPAFNSSPQTKRNMLSRYFQESLDKIPLTRMDIILTLDDLINSSTSIKSDQSKILEIIEKQSITEKDLSKFHSASFSPECKQPISSDDFECARVLLTHLGFFSFDTFRESEQPSIVALDPNNPEFISSLRALDMISNRTSDTAFVFYVREGRVHPQEILNSVTSKHYVSNGFIDFLHSLGCSVNVKFHHGWTGNVLTSWRIANEDGEGYYDDHGGSAYDGKNMTLYWADLCNEIAFIVPSGQLPEGPVRYGEEDNSSLDSEVKIRAKSTDSEAVTDIKSLSSLSDDGTSNVSRNLSEAESTLNSWKKRNKQLSFVGNIGCDTKIMIIWLESIDDGPNLPISSLLTVTNTGVEGNFTVTREYYAFLIHPLKNGLFNIRLVTSLTRPPTVLPLVDGMLVSKRILGTFIRLTCLNLCRQRRLDADSYQPPHVKRRLKIQEMVKKFKFQMNSSQFYNYLFC